MRLQRRTAPIWGIILLGLAALLMARALGAVPDGLFDLILRAWPALLVLAGLLILLRDRLPLSGLIALILSIALVVGIGVYAFNARAGQPRSENQQAIAQALPANISLLRVRVLMLTSDVELLRAFQSDSVSGEFVGSLDNRVEISYEELPDNSVTLTLTETQTSSFPSLETVGRGALQLELPPDVPLDVEFRSTDGSITLNLSGTQLERLNVDAGRGDVIVTLPEYQPLASGRADPLGTLAAQNGNLTLRVPEVVAGRFDLDRGGSGIQPQYDANRYNFIQTPSDLLEARLIDIAEIVVRYSLVAPRGLIRLDVAEAAS
jgi:hypothetical protein